MNSDSLNAGGARSGSSANCRHMPVLALSKAFSLPAISPLNSFSFPKNLFQLVKTFKLVKSLARRVPSNFVRTIRLNHFPDSQRARTCCGGGGGGGLLYGRRHGLVDNGSMEL